MGHSITIFMKFSRPVDPRERTNTHQVSAHYHHYWWSYSTSEISEIYQNLRLWDTKYTLTRKVTNWFWNRGTVGKEETISIPTMCYLMTFQGHFLRPWPWHAMCHYEIEMSLFVWCTLTPNTISCFLIRNTQFSITNLHMRFTYITKHLLPKIQENYRIGISEIVGQRSRSQKMTL